MTPRRLTDKELALLFLVHAGLSSRAVVEMTSAELLPTAEGEEIAAVGWPYKSKLTALLLASCYTSVN
jgi:hypothetical protein